MHHGNSCPPSTFPNRLQKLASHTAQGLFNHVSAAVLHVVVSCPSSLKQPNHNILMVQPRCSRSLQISSVESKWAPGPCDTCTVPRLCTSSAVFLCSPVSAGPPCSAPSPGRHWRTDHAAHLEENYKFRQKNPANVWHPFTVVLFHNYFFMTYSAIKVYSSNRVFII